MSMLYNFFVTDSAQKYARVFILGKFFQAMLNFCEKTWNLPLHNLLYSGRLWTHLKMLDKPEKVCLGQTL
jgi:hypothetical protein